jgi:hypothetical protein
MPKWNIDKQLAKLEPGDTAGTLIQRVLADVAFMTAHGVKPTPEQLERGHGNIWCVGLGFMNEPKVTFYGQTIREAFLRARKAAKKDREAMSTPWGSPALKPKRKTKERKKSKSDDATT